MSQSTEDMDEKSSVVEQNLRAIEERVRTACTRAGRQRQEVMLIAVTKTFPASAIDTAASLGVTDVGENRVQELRDKLPEVTSRPRYHLIGHLQSNKAKDAAKIFDVIHTIDSVELAEKVSRHAQALGKSIDILIEINIGAEDQKSGIAAADAEGLARQLTKVPALRLRGLMAIPPMGTPEETRPYFRALRELRETIRKSSGIDLEDLSMGMTDDFEVAIEEGSTMIRLGRAIFGPRS